MASRHVKKVMAIFKKNTEQDSMSKEETTQPTGGVKVEPPKKVRVKPLKGVRVEPAPHGAEKIWTKGQLATNIESLMQNSCNDEYQKMRNKSVIQTSFEDLSEESPALAASNGLVNTVILAYNRHHHLVIRPEDIWFSILGQVNIYINANAEKLRHMFVAHKGKKALSLVVGSDPMGHKKGTIFSIDWATFGYLMGKEVEKNIIDPSLRAWYLPAFTTTTKVDQATASIMLMSSMQKYFTFECISTCGLPSVTLLGQKSDYLTLLARLGRLKTFGKEPTRFHDLLKPVLTYFVKTFDAPDSDEIKDFWQKIAHYQSGGSGPSALSGWITAFCFWDAGGKCFHQPGRNPPDEPIPDDCDFYPGLVMREEDREATRNSGTLVLDGVSYHKVTMEDVPPGYAVVPVDINDNGFIYKAEMVAGSLGIRLSSSGEVEEGEWDTVQPGNGWVMYEVLTPGERKKKEKREQEEMRRKWGY